MRQSIGFFEQDAWERGYCLLGGSPMAFLNSLYQFFIQMNHLLSSGQCLRFSQTRKHFLVVYRQEFTDFLKFSVFRSFLVGRTLFQNRFFVLLQVAEAILDELLVIEVSKACLEIGNVTRTPLVRFRDVFRSIKDPSLTLFAFFESDQLEI